MWAYTKTTIPSDVITEERERERGCSNQEGRRWQCEVEVFLEAKDTR